VNRRPNILIFRDYLLSRSESFILAQTQALKNFEPYYAGSRWMDEIPLPPGRAIVINKYGRKGRFLEIPFKLFGYAPSFLGHIRAVDPVLIHANFGPDGVLALPIARALRVPLIVTFGGYDATVTREAVPYPFYNSHRIYFRKESILKREARQFIAVSNFIRSKLLDRGFPPEKIIVHYRGVDTQALRPDPGIPRQPVVFFAGRLVEVKGCEYLIRAMKAVQAHVPGVRLVIAGDGPLRPALEKLAREENLTDCLFAGWQSHADIRPWLVSSRVYCAPSIAVASGAEEGLSNAVLEAMACGLPVVSFSSGGNPEAIVHGTTGFLAPEKNAEQLSAHIVRLLQDSALWNQFSQAGQDRVRSQFDLYRQTEKLEGIYRSVLDAAGVPVAGGSG
jgi:colanic acid/amylovoran biosynthesis glycosyltransferase